MYFKGFAENNTVNIIDSYIAHNQAVWGAGFLVDVDYASKNRIVMKNVYFFNNSCPIDAETGGGAIRVLFAAQVRIPSNMITITNSTFDYNFTYFGGGVFMSTNPEIGVLDASNRIEFSNCIWLRNIARVSSAIDLSPFIDISEGQLIIPVFDNCSFIQNSNSYTTDIVQSVGLGSLNSDGIPTEFYNENYFTENDGTALSVLDALVTFKLNSSAVFYRNKGLRGGAIALLGSTILRIFPHTKLLFEENMATDKGGAIYFISLGVRDVINLCKCFIQYYDYTISPLEWETNFTFINNTSPNPGHSVYCTTLIPCSWTFVL